MNKIILKNKDQNVQKWTKDIDFRQWKEFLK